ncbi:Ig-like domain-containing protein [Candidatus Williamhamiltonella defendens]|uniref:Ig-like domain-containing protein n=1 Tax=Candidatus Williamhamiltonella defendens TaxID=138072 RepID=UPI000C1F8291|nr:Ig-like domain-containing protein [Candidatus Hamiltonella defensa]ATW32337.1 hypothetical protein BJP42_08660 [Candidatus Hamiltonella defensa]
MSGTATPTFEIKNVDPHAREINITATLGKSEDTAKKFQAVLNRDGSIKTNPDNGFFQKIKSVYKFKPNEGWNEGKYNIVVSVINEAHKESSDSSLLELIIDTSTPAQPSITLSDTSNTTHPTSLHEKWTSSRKPTFTIDLKDNNKDNPIEKVEVIVTRVAERVAENGIYIAKKDRNVWSPETKDKSSKKGTFSYMSNKLTFTPDDEWAKGEYSLSVKTYNSLNKPGDLSKKEVVNVNADKPAEPKIELAFADQTGKTIDKSNTKITNNPNPSFAISNINLKQDNIDERAVTITITKDGESKITGAKVTHDTGQFSYKTSNFKDTYGDGEYNATVRVINKAGIPSDSQEFTFEIDTTEPDKPEINWNSEAFKTAKNSDELKAVAKKGQIVFLVTTSEEIDDPRYITAKINNTGSLSAKEKVKDSKNVWKLTSNDSLSSGKHNLYVEVKDKAGNKNTAQGDFMVLEELPAPKIDMNHNTNAAGKTSTPYMINKANIAQDDKRKLNISLDDNRLFPYVEMKAELIISPGSSSVLSIKKNNLDNNWTVEIPEKQADGEYTLKVIATDVLKRTQKTEVDFEVDTTPPNTPAIQLNDSGTKSAESTDAQETTQTKPVFMIRNIPEDIYKINITISGDNNDYEIKNLEGFKRNSNEWGGILKDLEDNNEYSITVTFTDKAGNTSTNKEAPYKIKKIAPFVFKDPELILDPETDSGTQGDFKTNHNQPVLRFKNMSDTAVTALKINLKTEGKSERAYTYFLKKEDSKDQEGNEYTIELIKTTSLKGQDLFPAGKYEVTLELTYENNEKYKIPKTLSQSLIINRDKPDAVHDVKYTFNEEGGVKTIRIEGEKPKNTDIFIQFDGQTEINIKKQSGASLFSDNTFSTTQPWGNRKTLPSSLKTKSATTPRILRSTYHPPLTSFDIVL